MSNAQTNKDGILLEGRGICKGFAGVWEYLVLDHIDITIRAGEIHALLGENGAGKTVLANILSGFYSLTEGQIFVKGRQVYLKSPTDGIRHGIGMIHQELALVGPFTVAENIALGLPVSDFSYPIPEIEDRVREFSLKYGLHVDPKAKIEELSAGEQQRAEIMKVLYRNPEVLILDEPTSLVSADAEHLFKALGEMAEMGCGILFITHKIEEALEVGERVTVLRLGKLMGTRKTSEINKAELVELMFGKYTPLQIGREPVASDRILLEVKELHALAVTGEPALRGVSLVLREGEILGIAGIAGEGQLELAEVITGLRKAISGKVVIQNQDHTNSQPKDIISAGVAYIPEQRREVGMIEPMTVAENVVLKDVRVRPFSKWTFLNIPHITRHSAEIVEKFKALVPNLWRSPTRILSGGNIQRLILGRETWKKPLVLVAAYPTHGLDARAIEHTWKLFMHLRNEGSAILFISEDLDELIQVSDRIVVMSDGKIIATFDTATVKKEEIGFAMTTGRPLERGGQAIEKL